MLQRLGAAFVGPGYDADKDKLSKRSGTYISMTVPILHWGNGETDNSGVKREKDVFIKPRPDSRVDILISTDKRRVC